MLGSKRNCTDYLYDSLPMFIDLEIYKPAAKVDIKRASLLQTFFIRKLTLVIVKGSLRCGKEFHVLSFKKKTLRKRTLVKALFLLSNFTFAHHPCLRNILLTLTYTLIGGIKR